MNQNQFLTDSLPEAYNLTMRPLNIPLFLQACKQFLDLQVCSSLFFLIIENSRKWNYCKYIVRLYIIKLFFQIQNFQNNIQSHVPSLSALNLPDNSSSMIETKANIINQEQTQFHTQIKNENKLEDQNCFLSEYYQAENIPSNVDNINSKNIVPIVKRPTINRFHCNQCNIHCDERFENLSQLKQHTITNHGCFRCHICKEKFTRRSNLLRHCIKHIGFDPYVCKVCSATFKRKEILTRHIMKHHSSFTNANELVIQKISFSSSLDYLRQRQLATMKSEDSQSKGSVTMKSIKSEPIVADNENEHFEEISVSLM